MNNNYVENTHGIYRCKGTTLSAASGGWSPFQQVLSTGRLEPITNSLSSELLNIKSENEALARGEPPVMVILDDHKLHAREHRSVLANPTAQITTISPG